MKLKRLELNGFKSFPEKTVVVFPKGISGVVGPNGCGKSNLVDAVKWVMGEQSPRQLRGKGMEDVIFAGSNGKSSVGMAEVSLVLENDNGSIPKEYADYSEVVITRRLYRDGESEYAINNRPCRLKDITRLFMDTGVGSKAYSVIEQGKVGAIIDSKPEDRRHWIEEAAGISKYKSQKNETVRKLEAAQQNLLRVSDVINEVKRQMNSLHRQAKKAERFKELRKKSKEIDLTLLVKEYQELLENQKKKEEELGIQTEKVEKLREEWQEEEIRLDESAGELSELERQLREKQEAFYRLKGERDRQEALKEKYENEYRGAEREMGENLQEKEEIERWLSENQPREASLAEEVRRFSEVLGREEEELRKGEAKVGGAKQALEESRKQGERIKDLMMERMTELTRVRNQRTGLFKLREERQRRSLRQGEERDQTRERLRFLEVSAEEAEKALEEEKNRLEGLQEHILRLRHQGSDLNGLLKEREERLRDLEGRQKQERAQIEHLRGLMESRQLYEQGVRALLQQRPKGDDPDFPEFSEVLVQGLETEPGCETAVEAALGKAVQALPVEDPSWAIQGIKFLKRSKEGRAAFLPPRPRVPEIEKVAAHIREKGWVSLLSKVKAKEEILPWVEALLGDFVLVEDLEEGWKLWNDDPGRVSIVTRDGDVIGSQGILFGGSPSRPESGILFQKNLIRKLEEGIRDRAEAIGQIQEDIRVLMERRAALDKELERMDTERQEREKKALEWEKRLVACREEAKPLKRRLEMLRQEEEEYRELEEKQREEEEELVAQEKELNALIERLREDMRKREETTAELARRLDEERQRLTETYAKVSALREKGEHIGGEWKRLKELIGERRLRLGKLSERIGAGEALKAALQKNREEVRRRLEGLKEEVTALEGRIEDHRKAIEEKARQKEEQERELKEIRRRLGEAEDEENRLKMEWAQLRMKTEHLVSQVAEQTPLPPEEWIAHYLKGDEDLTALKEKRRELKEKLEQLGEVNLTALEEFNAFKERYDFLHAQEEDLLKSIDTLKKAIQKINATSKELFLSTFKAIQEKMNEVFPILFGGGSAKLFLTDEDDPLEAGVEILVHPPGKRVTNMSLLSGGEKALTALSLLFATYLVKPSPFCLLDEIDAFLDEANVERFKNLVRNIVRDSQIILITHNRRIMEMADALYGVTMEQPGVSKLVSVRLDQRQ